MQLNALFGIMFGGRLFIVEKRRIGIVGSSESMINSRCKGMEKSLFFVEFLDVHKRRHFHNTISIEWNGTITRL